MSNLYAEDILYWARDQRFRGILVNPSVTAHRENPSCGDSLTCFATTTDGKFERVRFDGTGCVICLASATVLAERAEGSTIDTVLAFNETNMVEWLACDVGPMRTNCMMLALLTLRDALKP
ncbi:MAG: iron-sulfur cluster assembly scaffold protein [Patescibacteria group bacterium]|jgi:nitrogen fixation NifU-like protein